ncbi:MAG: hypothetical protein ACYC6F_02810 [Longimicrobiales bacterium]
MGTSRNVPSPGQPPWKMARAMLGRLETTPERQIGQLWRAAAKDLREALPTLLSSAGVAAAADVAASGLGPREAKAAFTERVAVTRDASLFVDLAQRALVRVCSHGGGRAAFAQEFFAEATDYYASRDLPSVVGTAGRVANAFAASELKKQLRSSTTALVQAAAAQPAESTTWGEYVGLVLERLKAGR